jgi:hypothetical protein
MSKAYVYKLEFMLYLTKDIPENEDEDIKSVYDDGITALKEIAKKHGGRYIAASGLGMIAECEDNGNGPDIPKPETPAEDAPIIVPGNDTIN